VDGIDRLYWDEPYYLAPQGKTGIEAFAVIQEAMRESGKLAIGRLVMSARERICAIEPRGDAMVLTTIRAHDEVRDLEENVPLQKLPGVSRDMLAIANQIIAQKAGPFDPKRFRDRYEDALRDLLERKMGGKTIVASPPPAIQTSDNVVDLMAKLRASIANEPRSEAAEAADDTPRRPRARSKTKKPAAPKRRVRKSA
jgi:DNA end-binding protein Ku